MTELTKNFVVYAIATGEIMYQTLLPETDPDITEVGDEYAVIKHAPIDNTADKQIVIVDNVPTIVTVEVIVYATWNDIKNHRNQFADTPVFIVEHGLLDVDSASMELLQMAEDHFAFLPTVENGKLAWKMADNTIVYLTHPELIAMNAEAKDLRAKQVAIMFYRAEVLRAMDPAPTLEYVASYNNWIEP